MIAAQLPLGLRFAPDQRFDRYVDGRPESIAALRALARGESDDWIFLSGPRGSGKTHLCIAACAEAEARGRVPLYLALAGLSGALAEALAGRGRADLVVLDGLDAIAGHREDELALFGFHNAAHKGGTTLLYASREDPGHLPLVLPDLRSRLAQCIRFKLDAPTDAQRREVLRQRARMRGLVLEDPVLDWAMSRVDRDLATLTALLDRLDRESLAAQRRITIPFLRALLRDPGGP